jgi:hypothetical protein
MLKCQILRKTTILVISGFSLALLQAGRSRQPPPAELFLPASAMLTKELKVDFENDGEPDIVMASVANGGGPSDVITIKEIGSSTGQHGTVVILRTSGAGTAADWYVLSSMKHKIPKLEPGPLRAKILATKGYQDWGYNDVKSNHNLIVETQPGFSRSTARCCPDRPPIEMTFRFTGSSITLDSVKDLPFTRPTQ